jgi:D-alanyl-lipoteichoic acid acyltransferase DltB (MBOAT superfamily)
MSFVSLTFFIFLALAFALYWMRASRLWQNSVVLAASYVFYAWWDWRFCFLMLASSLVDFVAGIAIHRSGAEARRKLYLATALSVNVGVLGFFKYFGFFVDSLVIALSTIGLEVPTVSFAIILPIGISFYTFQTMSYTIDIYRGHYEPQRSVVDYLSFVSFFPQLVAGPIERATHLLPQFRVAREFSFEQAQNGVRLMLWGFLKKMVVADNLAPFVESIYGSVETASGASLVTATIFFSIQIYADFSAYSDIAAGTAALFGIRLMRNFALPYFSESITEFWRRWHISLSTWFRDYVYFPLGGNRVSTVQCCRNLMIICLLSGLWHGAAWTFVVWGFLHGSYLVIERLAGRNRLATGPNEVPGGDKAIPTLRRLLRIGSTYILVCLAWVFFRSESIDDAILIFERMFLRFGTLREFAELLAAERWRWGVIAGLLGIEWLGRRHWNPLRFEYLPLPVRWAGYTAAVWLMLLFGTHGSTEFIYFQF